MYSLKNTKVPKVFFILHTAYACTSMEVWREQSRYPRGCRPQRWAMVCGRPNLWRRKSQEWQSWTGLTQDGGSPSMSKQPREGKAMDFWKPGVERQLRGSLGAKHLKQQVQVARSQGTQMLEKTLGDKGLGVARPARSKPGRECLGGSGGRGIQTPEMD
jgi:hypothetical protein